MRLRSLLVWSLFAFGAATALAGGVQREPTRGPATPFRDAADPPVRADEDALAAAVNDAWITAVVKARLLRNDEIAGLDVDVDARDGVVTLFGMVPSLSAQASAHLEVAKTRGVHRVENLLEVVPEPLREATRSHDRALERVVRDRLVTRPEIGEPDFEVGVCNGVARLRGSVENEEVRRVALETVRDTDGVRTVVDQLQIPAEPSQRATRS